MGLSFLKKIKILSGVNLNFGTGGLSISVGPTGAKIVQKIAGKSAGSTSFYAQKAGVRYVKKLNSKKK